MGLLWVICYAVWNLAFIYGCRGPEHEFGQYVGLAGLHLGVPLFLMFGKSNLFIQMRGYALYFTVAAVLIYPFEPVYINTSDWYDAKTADLLGYAALALAVLLLLQNVRTARRQAAEDSPANLVQFVFGR